MLVTNTDIVHSVTTVNGNGTNRICIPCQEISEKPWPLICLFSLSVLHKMSSQAPLCQFNVLLCVSNNILLSEHDIRPFSKSLEPTGKWHTYYPPSSFCFNKMSS